MHGGTHRVQTIKTSPLRFLVSGQIHCALDDMSEDQLCNFRVEGILTDEEFDDRSVITLPTDNILTEIVITLLNPEVPINNFIKVKEIIALFV